jgi:predicted phage tail protein
MEACVTFHRELRAAGLAMACGLILAAPVEAASNLLTWTDNASNEANFKVERTTAADVPACATASGFTQIATTGANIVTFTDAAVAEGITYCYRVRASNAAGDSGYTNVAGRLVPFTVPAAPSGLGVVGGP